jgi:hypothetical protein
MRATPKAMNEKGMNAVTKSAGLESSYDNPSQRADLVD